MLASLRIDPADPTPIWRQIEEALRRAVASGQLGAGAAVPSVRDLARDLVVNPATVAKAYQRLCDSGVLAVKRGEGTFVADAPPSMSRAERSRILRDAALRYTGVARTIGAGPDEALDEVRAALTRPTARRVAGGSS